MVCPPRLLNPLSVPEPILHRLLSPTSTGATLIYLTAPENRRLSHWLQANCNMNSLISFVVLDEDDPRFGLVRNEDGWYEFYPDWFLGLPNTRRVLQLVEVDDKEVVEWATGRRYEDHPESAEGG